MNHSGESPRVTIVGLGLLGASVAAALRQNMPSWKLRGVSGAQAQVNALNEGLVDEVFGYSDVAAWLPGSHLVLLCTPINHIFEMLSAISTCAMDLGGTSTILVSDVGSTKFEICQRGKELPAPLQFIGGHPMAGSEKHGLEHRDPTLFENAYWIICPPDNLPPDSWAMLSQLISAVGSVGIILEPALHDHTLARLSHMPQLVSTALAGSLPPDILERQLQHLAGPGFRDMTRIAASPWSMWKDILQTNRREVLSALEEFTHSLQRVHSALEQLPPSPDLQDSFAQGGRVRSSLSLPGKGFSHHTSEVIVHIADRPGQIQAVVLPLTDIGLDIRDIELLKVREGIGGTLLLGFLSDADAEKAVATLSTCGLQARRR